MTSEEGKGSSFVFELVYPHKKLSESSISQQSAGSEIDLSGINVLLVEDNPVNQLVATDLLSEVNAQVDVANNGAEGVELFDASKHQVILMDMQMPVMDGYAAIKKLREDGFDVPIIALTAHITESEVDKCMNAGANEYLSKPYKPKDLYNKIAQLIGLDSGKVKELVSKDEVPEEEAKMWDKRFLLDYIGGSEKIMGRILDKIKSEIPIDTQTIINFQSTKDLESLGAVCHKMKPNIQMLGNTKLFNNIVQLEHDAKQAENLDDLQERVALLIVDLNELLAELV